MLTYQFKVLTNNSHFASFIFPLLRQKNTPKTRTFHHFYTERLIKVKVVWETRWFTFNRATHENVQPLRGIRHNFLKGFVNFVELLRLVWQLESYVTAHEDTLEVQPSLL